MKYQCDFEGWDERCAQAAIWAFDKPSQYGGFEAHYFCGDHAPEDWQGFSAAYHIVGDELVETGTSKRNREIREAGPTDSPAKAPQSHQAWFQGITGGRVTETITDASEANLSFHDSLILHTLGVKW